MRAARLRVNYLLEDTALFGGVKVVLHHANILTRRGHRVTVVSKGEAPAWFPLEAGFLQVPAFDAASLPAVDVTVATFWTTIAPAAALPGQPVHYCQGFEASYTHNRAEHPAILDAYRAPIPCFGVAPHLVGLVEARFGRPGRVVPPALEPFWTAPWRWRPHRTPRVLVVSPFEFDWKGVATALKAALLLRDRGLQIRIVRLSQLPLSEDECRLRPPDEFHRHLPPRRVARVVRSVDLLLAPSWEQEGFGLPVLEAMACGVPVVASNISSFRSFAAGAATLVDSADDVAFADAAQDTLSDLGRWRGMRREGLRVAVRFSPSRVGPVVEDALYWVAEGRWRDEMRTPSEATATPSGQAAP